MVKEILYNYAIDKNGDLVHVDYAEKGKAYFCPSCKNVFILRKSGNTGKGSRRPHFSHNNQNCSRDNVLHETFKKLLVDLLNKLNSEGKELIINWTCDDCYTDYSKSGIKRNILERAATIEEEYNLNVCRPDIAILDAEKNVIGAIEIVVTHKPEERVLDYYKTHGITLIQIDLSSVDDLNKVEERITNPNLVNYCLIPECQNFKNHQSNEKLRIITQGCPTCRNQFKKPYIEISSVFGLIQRTSLNIEEMKIAQSKGVFYKPVENKKTKVIHYEIRCPHCEASAKRMGEITRAMRRRYNKSRRF